MSEPNNTSENPNSASDAAVAQKEPPKPAPAKKPAPKPPAKKKGDADRRFFLLAMFGSWFTVAWVAFTASMVGLLLGTVRFLFPNVLSEPPSTYKAGDINNYEMNVVSDQYKDKGFWVIRSRDEQGRDIIYALSTICTHLGCTPSWLEGEQKFKCPCHGSGFYMSGVNFEGPAPRPLERFAVTRSDDGQVVVDKGTIFQQERGEWDDPKSYLLV